MWPFPSRKRAPAHGALDELQEKIERLEIVTRRTRIALDELAGDVQGLSERLNGQLGRILGGGPGRRPRAQQGAPGQLALEDIPQGDKAALRRYFRENPPAVNATQEEQ